MIRRKITNTVVSPTVSGTPAQGSTLTSSVQGANYSYQWYRGNPTSGGTAITGATAANYTVQASDAGFGIYLRVFQDLGAVSPGNVPLPAPQYTLLPSISGNPNVGVVLSVSNGTWANNPSSYSRQWYKDGVAISGATSTSYTVLAGDLNHVISCVVTATNATGSGIASAVGVTITSATYDWDWTVLYPDRSGVTSSTTYQVGPGKTYADMSTVPWQELQPGDVVEIYYQATPYKSIVYLGCRGTATKWITIKGMPGPNGERPVISGVGARCAGTVTQPGLESFGLFVIGRPTTGTHPQPDGYKPGYIHITGLAITGTGPSNSFVLTSGTALGTPGNNYSWPAFSSGIYCNPVEYLAVTDCELYGNGLGLFVNSRPGNSGVDLNGNQSRSIYVAGNYFHHNGVFGSASQHNAYTEAIGTVYEYNYFGQLNTGSLGDGVKDRSVGQIFRYNYFSGATGYQISLRDPESNVDNEKIRVDNQGALLFNNVFIYGNFFLLSGVNENGGTMIGYGDGYNNGGGQYIRHGNIEFYQNVVVSRYDKTDYARDGIVLFEPINQQAPVGNTEYPCTDTVMAYNNMFYADVATAGATPAPMDLFRRGGKADFQSNLITVFANTIPNWASRTADIWAGVPFDGSGLNGLTGTNYSPGFAAYTSNNFALNSNSPFFGLTAPTPAPAVARNLWCDDLYVTTPPTTLQGTARRTTSKPVATVLPVLTGSSTVGSTLTVTPGTWSATTGGIITLSYKWTRNGSPIANATGTSYTLTSADGGQVVGLIEYATNSYGTNLRSATPLTISVHPLSPANSFAPFLSGAGGGTNAGLVFTVNVGTWSNSPTSYAYQWYSNGTAIAGQTSSTIQTLGSWAGQTLTCKIWATNSYGQSLPVTTAGVVLGTAVALGPDANGLFNFVGLPDGTHLTDVNSAWTGSSVGNYVIQSGALKLATGTYGVSSEVRFVSGVSTATTQRITVVRKGNGNLDGIWVYLAYTNSSTNYTLRIANNAIVLLKNGAYQNACYYNTIPQANINYANDTTFVFEIVNGVIKAYINGVTAITQTDASPLTAGYIGIYPQSDAVSFSSLKIERS